jgi:transposase
MTTVSMAQQSDEVVVGVDTHADVHVAAAFDSLGRILGHLEVPTTLRGYAKLLEWARTFGQEVRFGIEGTGAYGAGLARFLSTAGCSVIEISRPDRRARRTQGKSDPIDAEAAGRTVLAGGRVFTAKAVDEHVGMIRTLRVSRCSAMKMRTQVINQMKALVVTAPDDLRARLRDLPALRLVSVSAAARPGPVTTTTAATKMALRCLATTHQELSRELVVLDAELARLTVEACPSLRELQGVGPDVAGALLVTAGDNPKRFKSEAAFARMCGVAPVPASSGKTTRYRLSRGGDRIANNALWRVAMVRLTCDERTRDYVARRTTEGKSKREIIRCLKRYIAREVYHAILVTSIARAGLDRP